ncbi:Protease domain-containing protein [Pandoravirus kuranda]|nr:Protease domain-containing protein [Pandoravirus kuranda]
MRQEPVAQGEAEEMDRGADNARADPAQPTAEGVRTDHDATKDWHFVAHMQWAETPEGRRTLAAYPKIKPRTPQEEAAHAAFARRIMARYAPART